MSHKTERWARGAPRVVHEVKALTTVRAYVSWWSKYWGIPNAPKVVISQRTLNRYGALGLYFPGSQTIVMGSARLRGIADVKTLEVELRHHANPVEKHEGEF